MSVSIIIRNVISHAHIVWCAHCFWVFHFKAVAGDGGAIVMRGGPVQGEEVHSSSGEGGRVWGGGRTCPRMKLQYIAIGTRGNSLFSLKHIPKFATLEYTYKPGACQTGKAHAHLTHTYPPHTYTIDTYRHLTHPTPPSPHTHTNTHLHPTLLQAFTRKRARAPGGKRCLNWKCFSLPLCRGANSPPH